MASAYQLTRNPITGETNVIIRWPDGAFIPTDPANADYVAFLAWLDEGNQADPASPDPAPDTGQQPKG